jgi:integrase
MALLTTQRGAPPAKVLRTALRLYAFNKQRREEGSPPEEWATALAWVEKNTVRLADLAKAAMVHRVLDAISRKVDDPRSAAAASTVARKRAVFSGALRYAVELEYLESNPLKKVKWEAPRTTLQVDKQVVPNDDQARRLLDAVTATTPELTGFFACVSEAGLRPEEALHLSEHQYERPKAEGEWGWLHLSGASPAPGKAWTDSGEVREDRQLKHREKKATRDVPANPRLCALLDYHIEKYPAAPDGRLFVTRRGPGGVYRPTNGRTISYNAYLTAFKKARELGFTPDEQASPLAEKPYDLRHGWVTRMIKKGVDIPLIAKWAGHTPFVLWKIYAHCVWGEEEATLRRLADDDGGPKPPVEPPELGPLAGPK